MPSLDSLSIPHPASTRLHASPPRSPPLADEDLINRSLLDSIDAPADPMLPREPEGDRKLFAQGTTSSTGSPSLNYRAANQSQLRPESPPSLHANSAIAAVTDAYMNKKHPAQSSLYNALHPQDVIDHDPTKVALNGFRTGGYQTSTAFNAFTTQRPRQNTAPAGIGPFRDYSQPFLPSADTFSANQGPQSHHPMVDPMSNSRVYEYDQAVAPPTAKAFFGGIGDGRYVPGSAILQSQQVQVSKVLSQQQHGQSHPYLSPTAQAYAAPNGMPVTGQPTQYPSHASVQPTGPSLAPTQATAVEEISTIFVVGFPDDMQEREFQNMFTFSVGFEAATLKIPNKDLNGYGGTASTQNPSGLRSGSFAANGYPNASIGAAGFTSDQFPVDGPTVWPAGVHPDDVYRGGMNDLASHATQIPTMPPRKQIIGFAKFKSRAEALDARDILQGRRVDIEKGAVLKAEMAKKNLHTKRGVGPLGIPLMMNASAGVPETLAGLAGINGLVSPPALGNGEALFQRERELGTIGAMGLGSSQRSRERDREREDDDRRRAGSNIAVGALEPPRPQLTREDEDKERRRRDKDALKQRMTPYDAFHSVPASTSRSAGAPAAGLVSPTEIGSIPSYPFPNSPPGSHVLGSAVHTFSSQELFAPVGTSGTWSNPERYNSTKAGANSTALSPRPPSSAQSSPPAAEAPFAGSMTSSSSSSEYAEAMAGTAIITQPHQSMLASQQILLPARPISNRSYSPPTGGEYVYATHNARSVPHSSSSSVVESQGSDSDDMTHSMTSLTMGTHHGMTSPQLPSPASGGSSATANARANGSDQNPPINTLYVGNLPTSPPPNLAPNHLEESLRGLFSRCAGYRKLCFRQKSNGPMCFVEFEDVTFATQAMREIYGDTLGGVVKTGIRLSYSKNPLGVRTPTNGPSTTPRADQASSASMSIQETFQGRHGSSSTSISGDLAYLRPREDAPTYPAPQSARFYAAQSSARQSFIPQQPMAGTFSRPLQHLFGQPPDALVQQHIYGLVNEPADERFQTRDVPGHLVAPSPGLEAAHAV